MTDAPAAGGLSLRANTLWNAAGIAVYTATQWGILVAVAKLGEPRAVGQIALGLAISAPAMVFANLALRQVLATDSRGDYRIADYVRLRLLTTALGVLAIAAIGVAFGGSAETIAVVAVLGVAKGFESISDILYGGFQRRERLDVLALSLALRGALALLAVVVAMVATGRLVHAVAAWALAWLAVLLLHDVPRASGLSRAYPEAVGGVRGTLAALARQALPLGIAGMLVMANLQVPRYFLAHFDGEAALGFFAAAAYMPMAGRRALEAIAQAATPRLARLYSAGRRVEFRRLLVRLILGAAACGGVGVLVVSVWGGAILTLAYTAEYAPYAHVFVWLMVAWSLRYLSAFVVSGIVAARRFRVVPRVYLGSTVVLVLFGPWLVGRYGVAGAAALDVLSALVQLVAVAIVSRLVIRPAEVGAAEGAAS